MSQTRSQEEVFDRLASGWYGYRHHTIFRTELAQLAARWQGGSLLNIGCGHGADFLPFTNYIQGLSENVKKGHTLPSPKKISSSLPSPSMGEDDRSVPYLMRGEGAPLLVSSPLRGEEYGKGENKFELYGLDFSLEMLRLAQKYARKYSFTPFLFQADMRVLPFRDAFFDCAIAVASYHHIKNRSDRLTAFTELKRVLKPGGEAFITVWNHWQPRFWLKRSDTLVPWRAGDDILYRYYHLYSYTELAKAVRRSGLIILRSFPENSYRFPLKYFSRNICLLVKKT